MFFLTLWANPLVRKIAIYAAMVSCVLLLLRWYGNREYYKGVDQGIKTEADRLVKAKAAEWKLREDAIIIQAKQVADQGKILNAQRIELATVRTSLINTLAEIQSNSQASQGAANAIVNSIPGDLLDSAIRYKSTELGPPKVVK